MECGDSPNTTLNKRYLVRHTSRLTWTTSHNATTSSIDQGKDLEVVKFFKEYISKISHIHGAQLEVKLKNSPRGNRRKHDWFNPSVTKQCPKCHKIEKMFTVCMECLNRMRDTHEPHQDRWELSPECEESALKHWKEIVRLRKLNVGIKVIMQEFGLDRYTIDWVLKRAKEKGELKRCTK